MDEDRKEGEEAAERTYDVRPDYKHKYVESDEQNFRNRTHSNDTTTLARRRFPVHAVKEIIRGVLSSKLRDQEYHMEYTAKWSREIADSVRNKLKELQVPRYKYMVQVLIGEKKGQGVRYVLRGICNDNNTRFSLPTTFAREQNGMQMSLGRGDG